MICVDIAKSDTKKFMAVLLQSKGFHSLWVHSVTIDSFMHIAITRSMKVVEAIGGEKEEGDATEIKKEYKHQSWEQIRPLILSMIVPEKPQTLKVVFQLPDSIRLQLDENIKGFYCNIDYVADNIRLTTKVATDTIGGSKAGEHQFDEMIIHLLHTNEIEFLSQI